MKTVAKLQSTMQWKRLAELRIWNRLVECANHRDEPTEAVEDSFQALVEDAMAWTLGDFYNGFGDIELCRDFGRGKSLKSLITNHRPHINEVLTWLAAPESNSAILAHRAGRFLNEHANGLVVVRKGLPEFDDNRVGILMQEDIGECRTIMSPICRFLIDQINSHDSEGRELKEALPIGICERTDCGRFFVIERMGRGRFCSDSCRAKSYQATLPKEERAARMRKHRERLKEMASKPIGIPKKTAPTGRKSR